MLFRQQLPIRARRHQLTTVSTASNFSLQILWSKFDSCCFPKWPLSNWSVTVRVCRSQKDLEEFHPILKFLQYPLHLPLNLLQRYHILCELCIVTSVYMHTLCLTFLFFVKLGVFFSMFSIFVNKRKGIATVFPVSPQQQTHSQKKTYFVNVLFVHFFFLSTLPIPLFKCLCNHVLKEIMKDAY